MNTFNNILKHFFFYGIFGLLMEAVWTGILSFLHGDKNMRCTTYLWMFFIYGSGVLFEPVHNIIRPSFWVMRGFIWAALIFTVEFAAGFFLEKTIGSCPWDYGSETALSVKGYIRFDYLPVWFALGLIFERLHDFLVVVL